MSRCNDIDTEYWMLAPCQILPVRFQNRLRFTHVLPTLCNVFNSLLIAGKQPLRPKVAIVQTILRKYSLLANRE